MERDFFYELVLYKNAEIMNIMMEHAHQLNELLDNAMLKENYQEDLDNFDQQLKLSKAIRLLSETSHMMVDELYRLNIEIEKLKVDNN